MGRKWIWLVLGVVLAVTLYLFAGRAYDALSARWMGSASAGGQTAEAAPDFTVYDGTGNPVKLSDFAGRPVVLNFWASWCGPCKQEMPGFETAYRQYGGEAVFLMVNVTGSDDKEEAEALVQKTGYTFPVYYDLDREAEKAYGIDSFPRTYLIRADGTVGSYALGSVSEETLLKGIGEICAEQ